MRDGWQLVELASCIYSRRAGTRCFLYFSSSPNDSSPSQYIPWRMGSQDTAIRERASKRVRTSRCLCWIAIAFQLGKCWNTQLTTFWAHALTIVFSSHHRHQPYLVLQVDIHQTHYQAAALHNWRPWMREHSPIAYWHCRHGHDRAPTCLLKQLQQTQKHKRDQHKNWVPRNLLRPYNSFSIGLLKWNQRWKGIKKISIGEWHGCYGCKMNQSLIIAYRNYLGVVSQYRQSCDDFLKDLEDTSKLFDDLGNEYGFVEMRTRSLQSACEKLLNEQV